MANKLSGWYGTPYTCAADPSLSHGVGWYYEGQLISTEYNNPATGAPWTTTELSGGTASTPSTTTPTGGSGVQDVSGLPSSIEGGWTTSDPYSNEIVQQMLDEGTYPSAGILWGQPGAPTIQQLLSGQYPQTGQGGATATPTTAEQIALMPGMPTATPPTLAPAPTVTPFPTVGAPTVPSMPGITPAPTIPAVEVPPAPEYVPSEEEQAFAETYGGTIGGIIKARGEGIPEATIQLMIRQTTQTLQAREDEQMRVMHNDMERRGITESGLVFWNQQKIKAATTTAIANEITDIQIKSALMKMASFENALGHAGQFLGYLQEQSKMIYAGKMATWEAQTQANFIRYQAQINVDMDQWKMVNQFNLADWQANTQALFAQWDKNSATMVEAWKMENQFSIAEWETRANYDMAVFQIETQALMANWSAQMDIYKMGITQAYAQDNMNLTAQINEEAAAQQQIYNVQLTEMELEAANQQAAAQGAGSIVGTVIKGICSLITG